MVTMVLPSQKPCVSITWVCGPSSALCTGSDAGLPMVKVPGGIHVMSRVVLSDSRRFQSRPVTGPGAEFLAPSDAQPPPKTNKPNITPAAAIRISTVFHLIRGRLPIAVHLSTLTSYQVVTGSPTGSSHPAVVFLAIIGSPMGRLEPSRALAETFV